MWLLQWLLCSRPQPASSWFLVFTCFNRPTFTRQELIDWLWQRAFDNSQQVSKNTIRRDVQVLLQMYVPVAEDRANNIEVQCDRPLAELGLIRHVDHTTYSIQRQNQQSLPTGILVCALADYWNRHAKEQTTLTVEQLLYGEGSPGAAFRLRDQDLVALLEKLPRSTGFVYDETAGQRQLQRNRSQSFLDTVRKHYKHAAV